MPRKVVSCAMPNCKNRLEGKVRKINVEQPSFKPVLQLYLLEHNLKLEDSGFVCSSCHMKAIGRKLHSPSYRKRRRVSQRQILDPQPRDQGRVLRSSSTTNGCQNNVSIPTATTTSPSPESETHDTTNVRRTPEQNCRSDRSNFINGSQSSVSTSASTDISSSCELDDCDNDEFITDKSFSEEQSDSSAGVSSCSCHSKSVDETGNSHESQEPNMSNTPARSSESQGTSSSQSLSSASNDSQASTTSAPTKLVIYIELPGVKIVKGHDKRCFICPIQRNPPPLSRSRIPMEAKANLLYKEKVFIPSHLRCCPKHIENEEFTDEAKTVINRLPPQRAVPIEELEDWVKIAAKTKPPSGPTFDFSKGNVNYVLLTGFTREQFEMIHSRIEHRLHNSCNRNTRQALAAFLMLLRTGQPQEMIGYQLNIDQQVVSAASESVSKALYDTFVPEYLGYNHMSREEALKTHSRQTCFEIPDDKIAIVIDGTYIFRDKPGNFKEQQDSYSKQKKRNFDRYAVIVLASGYCVDVVGPFPAKVNDAECLNTMLHDADFVRFLGDGAHLFVDRGYRDCLEILKQKGYIPHAPDFLPTNQDQFTADQANHTRKVTKTRWVVEAKNGMSTLYTKETKCKLALYLAGQIKQVFKFFMYQIQGGYKHNIERFFKIAMALLNAFRPVSYTETARSIRMVNTIRDIANVHSSNALKEKIEILGIINQHTKWTKMSVDDFPDFPTVDSLEEFEDEVTFGSYQATIASRYIHEHMKADGDFTIMIHECIGTIVRAKITSRMSKIGKDHNTFVEYDPAFDDAEGIVETWCQCIVGGRQAGCCAHVAAVLRYMMFDRHAVQVCKTRKRRPIHYIETIKIKKPQPDAAGPSKPKRAKRCPKLPKPGKSPSKRKIAAKKQGNSNGANVEETSTLDAVHGSSDDGHSVAIAELATSSE